MKRFTWTGRRGLMAILLMLPCAAGALINPNFSPVHLVKQSETILELTFAGVDDAGMVKAVVQATVKGKEGQRKEITHRSRRRHCGRPARCLH